MKATFSPEERVALLDRLFDWMAQGGYLRQFARDNDLSVTTLYRWATDEAFAERYARARESQAHALAEQALEIADGIDELTLTARELAEIEADKMEPDKAREFLARYTAAEVQRDRLRTDARKWYTGKVYRKVFGDAVDVTTGGEKLVAAVIALPLEELPSAPRADG